MPSPRRGSRHSSKQSKCLCVLPSYTSASTWRGEFCLEMDCGASSAGNTLLTCAEMLSHMLKPFFSASLSSSLTSSAASGSWGWRNPREYLACYRLVPACLLECYSELACLTISLLSNADFAGSGGLAPRQNRARRGTYTSPAPGPAPTKNLDAGGAAGLGRPRSKQEALRIHTNKRNY